MATVSSVTTFRIIDLKVHGIVERIPEGNLNDEKFADWCRANKIIPLYDKKRRGWDARREIYIGDAQYMIILDEKGCGARIYMTEEDLKHYELEDASQEFTPKPGPTHEIVIGETTVSQLLGVKEKE